jgi:hypothetical protein
MAKTFSNWNSLKPFQPIVIDFLAVQPASVQIKFSDKSKSAVTKEIMPRLFQTAAKVLSQSRKNFIHRKSVSIIQPQLSNYE